MDTKNIGLRNIEVADTKISYIDGQKGKLIYRGYDILDLTKNSNFEETCFLLLHDELPTSDEYVDFKTELVDARIIPKQMQINMGNWRKDAAPMDVLQAFVAAFGGFYDEEFSTKEASFLSKIPSLSFGKISSNFFEIIKPKTLSPKNSNFSLLSTELKLLCVKLLIKISLFLKFIPIFFSNKDILLFIYLIILKKRLNLIILFHFQNLNILPIL